MHAPQPIPSVSDLGPHLGGSGQFLVGSGRLGPDPDPDPGRPVLRSRIIFMRFRLRLRLQSYYIAGQNF
jgi:hypothetical protein